MILVGNGTVVTRDPENPFIFQGAVVTNEQGLIEKVGTWEQLEARFKSWNELENSFFCHGPGGTA